MPGKMDFEAAVLDELVFIVPDSAKLTIKDTNANSLSHILPPGIETVILYKPVKGPALTEKGQITTDKLIAACKLQDGTYVAHNFHDRQNLRWKDIKQTGSIKRVFLMGVTMQDLGVHVESILYKIFNFNGLDVLISESMEVIGDEDKKVLWARIQTLFH